LLIVKARSVDGYDYRIHDLIYGGRIRFGRRKDTAILTISRPGSIDILSIIICVINNTIILTPQMIQKVSSVFGLPAFILKI